MTIFGRRYARAMLVVIAASIAFGFQGIFFMERHWEAVARRLSEATGRDIAALVDMYGDYSQRAEEARLIETARDRLNISMQVLPAQELPPVAPRPFIDPLDRSLSADIARHVKHPFWLDTVAQSRFVEVRVRLEKAVLRFTVPRSLAYASNSHIFALWMVSSSILLIGAALVLVRRPG